MADVQVVHGAPDEAVAGGASEFVEVLVEATGKTSRVPREWLDSPVLGKGLEKTMAQKVADGDVEPAVVADPPTEKDTVEVIQAFAEAAQIDLGDASTKKEKVAVITAALDTASAGSAPGPVGNPDVQLVMSTQDDLPWTPAGREAAIAARNQDTAGTKPSDETPATGEEEN